MIRSEIDKIFNKEFLVEVESYMAEDEHTHNRRRYTGDSETIKRATQKIEALITKSNRELLNSLLAAKREYEITDLELMEHHGETPLIAVPVVTIEKYLN